MLSFNGGMSAIIALFLSFFFPLKASFLKGISIQAITSFGENTVKLEDRQTMRFVCSSGTKTMLIDQTSVLRHFIRSQQVAFSL